MKVRGLYQDKKAKRESCLRINQSMATRFVFVYGTLKRGEPNHRFLQTAKGLSRFIGMGRLMNKFPLVVASKYNIPFLLNNPGEGYLIKGEVYEIDDVTLKDLDVLEGYPDLYTRQEEMVEMDNGSSICALLYNLRNYDRKLLDSSSSMMEEYSSLGPHVRPYVDGENCETYDDLFR